MGVRGQCDSLHHLQLCLGTIYYFFWQGLGKVMQKSFCTPAADVVKSLNGFKSNASGCVCVAHDTNQRVVLMVQKH